MAVANFPCFLAPEMVPSRMSNLAVGLWSGFNDLRNGLMKPSFSCLFGCFLICGSYMPGMCLWKWQLVSWSEKFDRFSGFVFFDEQSYFMGFFQISRMCGVAVGIQSSARELDRIE